MYFFAHFHTIPAEVSPFSPSIPRPYANSTNHNKLYLNILYKSFIIKEK